MGQTSTASRDGDRPSSERLFVLLGTVTVVGGIGWVVLTPLEALTSGATEDVVGYLTEPLVGLLGAVGSYGLMRLQETAVDRQGHIGHGLLTTGFLVVGVPAALDGVVLSIPKMQFLLRQPDAIQLSTLAGLVLVYVGSALVGADGRSREGAPHFVTGTLLLAPLLAMFATALAYATGATTWISTAVTGPAGLALAAIGYSVLALIRPRSRDHEGASDPIE